MNEVTMSLLVEWIRSHRMSTMKQLLSAAGCNLIGKEINQFTFAPEPGNYYVNQYRYIPTPFAEDIDNPEPFRIWVVSMFIPGADGELVKRRRFFMSHPLGIWMGCGSFAEIIRVIRDLAKDAAAFDFMWRLQPYVFPSHDHLVNIILAEHGILGITVTQPEYATTLGEFKTNPNDYFKNEWTTGWARKEVAEDID